ncbi:MAG TPA: hypothetical protein VFZ00_30785 [Solirubrobacter sp.]|jgi:hypothetical protein|nr:hypothetical protein [Solirubrobacter sp.]
MAELLDKIHAEIRERLEAARPAAEEYKRLEAALDAMGGPIAITAKPTVDEEEPPLAA